ncbi:serine/arginine repetitive matrix protein 1-like isoform X1 [Macrobrachium rosenbergii]|uniref:serine/arginine repetitive matrix protein 1-like isoform X1 n=1 Tax=Macrobrachium rosenbergii TaxID=79674 RepID=UPI0034D648EB
MYNHKFKRGLYGSENISIKLEEGIGDLIRIKREQCSSSDSPTPGPSRGRSRSISPRRGYFGKSPSHSRDYSHSPSWRHQSRSPSFRHQSSSPSPMQERRRNWSSSSSASESRLPSPKRGIDENSIFKIKREPLSPDLPRVRDSEDLSSYRNRSPPPVQIKAEPVSPPVQIKAEPVSPPVQIKAEPVSPPVWIKSEPPSPPAFSDNMHAVQMPVAVEKQKSDAAVQTNLNLEVEMMHLNDYIKNCKADTLRTPLEAKAAIDLMNTYALAIRGVILKMEDRTSKSPEKMRMLEHQKAKIEKVIGYVTKWYVPTWQRELNRQ